MPWLSALCYLPSRVPSAMMELRIKRTDTIKIRFDKF
jgi:hypothetical protein